MEGRKFAAVVLSPDKTGNQPIGISEHSIYLILDPDLASLLGPAPAKSLEVAHG